MVSVFRMGFQALIRPAGVGSVLLPFGGDEIEHLERGLLVGEVASVADGLAEPGVQALDGVGIRYEIRGTRRPRCGAF
jgi:hypothetical protein